jgi:peroxiredoxin
MIAAGDLSRRAVLVLLVGTGMALPSGARSESDSGPPALRSATSQFVELRPLAEAPPLKLERIDGKVVGLNAFRGKVVLMSFWATWCPPCRRELPILERLTDAVGHRDVEVVAVSVDQPGRPAVSAFLDRVGIRRLKPFLDPQGRIGVSSFEGSASPFVLYGMPISYVIDRQGRVTGYITGEIDWTSNEGLALLHHYIDAGP